MSESKKTPYSFNGFRLEVEEPCAVLFGETYDKAGWGPYQFPALMKTSSGSILCTCNGPDTQDSIEGYEGEAQLFGRASDDGGKTWRTIRESDDPLGISLPGGYEFFPPKAKNAFRATWLNKYVPDARASEYLPKPYRNDSRPDLYRSENIPEFSHSPIVRLCNRAACANDAFSAQFDWPHLAMCAFPDKDGGLIYPFDNLPGIMGHIMADPDGTMFLCTYMNGFSGESGEPAFLYSVYVLRSDDMGRTWQYQSEILTPKELSEGKSGFEGFCEPQMERMPDGSVIMLMRTGSGQSSYLTHSEDDCRTWSKPYVFDSVGVFPRLLRLGCGVTLASYGRPGVFLRATNDPAGLCWEQPIDLGIPHDYSSSCCYSAMLALDETSALIAYSHFHYPNPDGIPVKTILVRKITVIPS